MHVNDTDLTLWVSSAGSAMTAKNLANTIVDPQDRHDHKVNVIRISLCP